MYCFKQYRLEVDRLKAIRHSSQIRRHLSVTSPQSRSQPKVIIKKVRSYYTVIALRCRYIDYISDVSHRSITTFQVKMNLTSCDTAQCSNIA